MTSNGATPIDEIKIRTVIARCDKLRELSPNNPQYAVVLRQLAAQWQTLSTAEQDEIDRIFGQRGLSHLN